MSRLFNQRGDGRTGFIIALAVAGALIFTGLKILPVRISSYRFHDILREEARYAAVRDSTETVTRRILAKARDYDIPLEAKKLDVRKTGSEVIIKASYEQPIDLKLTTYVYKFQAEERAPLF